MTPSEPFFLVNGPQSISRLTLVTLCPSQTRDRQGIVEWYYITQLYESSDTLRLKLAKKLTEKHIHPKPFVNMKVKFTNQVMSESVSSTIHVLMATRGLPRTTTPTGWKDGQALRLYKQFHCCITADWQAASFSRRGL